MPIPLPAPAVTTLLLTASNVFMTFALVVIEQRLRLDFLWAALCLVAAVYFVFRSA